MEIAVLKTTFLDARRCDRIHDQLHLCSVISRCPSLSNRWDRKLGFPVLKGFTFYLADTTFSRASMCALSPAIVFFRKGSDRWRAWSRQLLYHGPAMSRRWLRARRIQTPVSNACQRDLSQTKFSIKLKKKSAPVDSTRCVSQKIKFPSTTQNSLCLPAWKRRRFRKRCGTLRRPIGPECGRRCPAPTILVTGHADCHSELTTPNFALQNARRSNLCPVSLLLTVVSTLRRGFREQIRATLVGDAGSAERGRNRKSVITREERPTRCNARERLAREDNARGESDRTRHSSGDHVTSRRECGLRRRDWERAPRLAEATSARSPSPDSAGQRGVWERGAREHQHENLGLYLRGKLEQVPRVSCARWKKRLEKEIRFNPRWIYIVFPEERRRKSLLFNAFPLERVFNLFHSSTVRLMYLLIHVFVTR